MLPLLHAGGFSWDELIVLVVAILAVPALSWFTGRWGQRRDSAARLAQKPRRSVPTDPDESDDVAEPVVDPSL